MSRPDAIVFRLAKGKLVRGATENLSPSFSTGTTLVCASDANVNVETSPIATSASSSSLSRIRLLLAAGRKSSAVRAVILTADSIKMNEDGELHAAPH